jgi:two-component system NtrC family sensor kinase
MSLTRKLVLTLVAGFLPVLVASAWLGVWREAALLDSDERRDHLLLGRALARDLGAVLTADGLATAQQRASRTTDPRDHVRVRWLDLAEGSADRDVDLSPEERARVRAGAELGKRVRGAGQADVLRTYVPVLGTSRFALEVSEAMTVERDYLRRTIRHVAASTLVLLLVAGGLAVLIGRYFVSRPIASILTKIHDVAAGQLGGEVRLSQRDELGAIASALNEMSAALVQAHAHLEAETQARIAAVEQLRHADRLMTVGKLASGMAHELGTPLSIISGRAEMLLLGDSASVEEKEIARIIRSESHRIAEIIRQLLDFARKRTPQKVTVALRTIALRTVTLLGPMAEKRGVELLLAPAGGELRAPVDDGQIQQVLANLVTNALQATAAGGRVTVALSHECIAPPVDVGGRAASYLKLAVADTGCGMPPEVVARVFEPFFTTKEVGEGTGLGLSVAYGIVREHDGWIAVESTPGQGSVFSVFLPAQEQGQGRGQGLDHKQEEEQS